MIQYKFMSIDVTGGRAMDWVLLGTGGELKHQTGSLEKIVEAVRTYSPRVIAVDAPLGPNRQLLDAADRARLGLADGEYLNCRVAEAELNIRGINCYTTGRDHLKASKWVAVGWDLYENLRKLGYDDGGRPGTIKLESDGRWFIEVFPYASFVVRLQWIPAVKTSLAGNIERIACVLDWGASLGMTRGENWPSAHFLSDLRSAMELMTVEGILRDGARGVTQISHDQLDALVGALTARAAFDGTAFGVGRPEEGVIVLPRPPEEKYRRRGQ